VFVGVYPWFVFLSSRVQTHSTGMSSNFAILIRSCSTCVQERACIRSAATLLANSLPSPARSHGKIQAFILLQHNANTEIQPGIVVADVVGRTGRLLASN
jgi:hypothetical protein